MNPEDRIGIAEAAEILGVRPCLVTHRMDSGVLPSEGEGADRTALLSDVTALRDRDAEFGEAMAELYALGLDSEGGTPA